MSDLGKMLVGAKSVTGREGVVQGINPATGEKLAAFGGGGLAEIEAACALAHAAFPVFREIAPGLRAAFLEKIAENILGLGDVLIETVMAESGLPRPRLEGERGRTVGQLRLFAQTVREASWMRPRIDPAMPDRKPLPRADLRLRWIGLGPVAVFGASNFPLAFSVAGGDTASALAAGCPVVAKAHPAHPATSALIGGAIQAAVRECGLPEGVFSLLYGVPNSFGTALVQDHRIKAVGFTGSRGGGTALMAAAAARPEPIPVYAEMSSINPVILFPAAIKARGAAIADAFVKSLTLGVGQFCTSPGLVLALDGPDADAFAAAAAAAVCGAPAATMLTPGIHAAYNSGVSALASHAAVENLARGQKDTGPNQAQPGLFQTNAAAFSGDHALQAEIFGPSSLLVRCRDMNEMAAVLEKIEGQLTIALHMDEADHALARGLMPVLETKAGRLLVNGFGTGVEVSHAMVHGGPFPATSDSRTTSVGTLAMERFLRPVCYQDMPQALLPDALKDGNPLGAWRLTDGAFGKD